MQANILIATVLIVLFALVSAKWSWVEDEDRGHSTAIAGHEGTTLGYAVRSDDNTLAYSEAEVLQQQGSLSHGHQEAKDADALLNALIKRLTQQIADDAAATNQKVTDRNNSIKKFDDAVTSAKAFLEDLSMQQIALNRKLDEAKTAHATRQGERTAEQAVIDKENAEQKARLADRIAAVEKQIALIKQIIVLLSGQAPNPQVPDSIIADSKGEAEFANLFANTKFAGKKFEKIFVASQNNYEAAKYFAAAKGKTNLFTIIKSANGNVFGGFSSFAMDGSWTWKVDGDAFIFSYIRGAETKMVKLLPTPQNDNRVSYLGHVSFGPVFGADDVFTSDKCNANSNSMSMLGRAFATPNGAINNGARNNFVAGSNEWTCADYEVFQLV